MQGRAAFGGRRDCGPLDSGGGTAAAAPPAPIDPQNWSFQDNLTWNDYHALPGTDYSDPSIQPTVKKWKVALVVDGLPGQAVHDHAAGGRDGLRHADRARRNNIPRADVPAFYATSSTSRRRSTTSRP